MPIDFRISWRGLRKSEKTDISTHNLWLWLRFVMLIFNIFHSLYNDPMVEHLSTLPSIYFTMFLKEFGKPTNSMTYESFLFYFGDKKFFSKNNNMYKKNFFLRQNHLASFIFSSFFLWLQVGSLYACIMSIVYQRMTYKSEKSVTLDDTLPTLFKFNCS